MRNKLILVLLAIFAIPLGGMIPVAGADIWYAQYLVLLSMLPIGIAVALWKFNKYISLFLLVCTFSTMVGHNGESWVLTQQPRSILCLVQICLVYLAVYQISTFSDKYRRYVLYGIIGLFCLQGFWVILQWFNIDPVWDGVGTYMSGNKIDDTVGLSGSHNQVGLFFAVVLPLITAYCWWLLPLGIFGLFCSTTTAAFVGGIVGCFVYGLYRFRFKFLVIGIPLVILCSLIFYNKFETISSVAFNQRISLVKHSITAVESGKIVMKRGNQYKIITCNPWFGYRLGNFMRISPWAQDFMEPWEKHVYSHAHNDYVEVYFDLGRLGFISLMLILIDFFWKFWKAKKTKMLLVSFSCVVAHMVCALGIFTVQTAVSGMMLILFLGIFYGSLDSLEVDDGKSTV